MNKRLILLLHFVNIVAICAIFVIPKKGLIDRMEKLASKQMQEILVARATTHAKTGELVIAITLKPAKNCPAMGLRLNTCHLNCGLKRASQKALAVVRESLGGGLNI